MPTSAAGNRPRPGRDAGFTLVELMVVVTIIGLMGAAVVLMMPDPGGSLRQEAERLAARASAARNAAIVDARSTALLLGPEGYGFARRSGGQWVPITQKPLQQRAWNQGVTASKAPAGGERVVFDSTGLAEPAIVTLARGDDRVTVRIGQDGGIDVE